MNTASQVEGGQQLTQPLRRTSLIHESESRPYPSTTSYGFWLILMGHTFGYPAIQSFPYWRSQEENLFKKRSSRASTY